jgi:hypothetical protein
MARGHVECLHHGLPVGISFGKTLRLAKLGLVDIGSIFEFLVQITEVQQ